MGGARSVACGARGSCPDSHPDKGVLTTPQVPADAWEASVDDGRTWTPAIELDGESLWLFNGHLCDEPDAPGQVNLSASVVPLLRVVDSPEVLIRSPFEVVLQ